MLIDRIAGRLRREAIWYLKYRWNPFNPHPTAAGFRQDVDGVRTALSAAGMAFESLRVSASRYVAFVEACRYPAAYHGGQGSVFTEKSLEHYLSWELLGIDAQDIYLDVASDRSPFPDFVRASGGCQVFVNDLSYPPGITDGGRIGSDATRLPLPDESISKVTLHCSLEHFEGDSDMRLMRELGRVLRPGGKVCILPLYLHTRYSGLTDPLVDRTGMEWDPAMAVVLDNGYGQRHGRLYDVLRLQQRLYARMGALTPRLYNVENLDEIAPGLWCHWILVLEKSGR